MALTRGNPAKRLPSQPDSASGQYNQLLLVNAIGPSGLFKPQKFARFMDGSHHRSVWPGLLRQHLRHAENSKNVALWSDRDVHGCGA